MSEMKVVRFYPPGGAEKLRYETEPVPTQLEKGQMLVKVHAVGLIWTELHWPIYQQPDGTYVSHIPGHDFSGVVTEVGPGFEDSDIRPGSEIYAFTRERKFEGAMAEYAKADLPQAMLKPRNLSFVEAASVPLSALTAWQALYDHASLRSGQKLLVTGAAGATGVFAVQLGRVTGAHVIGTASSPRSFELLQNFGVNEVVNYKESQLEEAVKDVDVVFDTVGGDVLKQCLKVVRKGGVVINIVDYNAGELARQQGVQGKFFIVEMHADQLARITELIEKGVLRTVVDSVFPLDQAREAFEHGAAGHAHGKIVVSVST